MFCFEGVIRVNKKSINYREQHKDKLGFFCYEAIIAKDRKPGNIIMRRRKRAWHQNGAKKGARTTPREYPKKDIGGRRERGFMGFYARKSGQ